MTLADFILAAVVIFLMLPSNSVRPVQFTDVTSQSGIDFFHHSDPEKKYIVESMSGGLALFDFNNDGWLDVYFVNSLTVRTVNGSGHAKSRLYRNNKNGTFTDVTDRAGVGNAGWGMGASVGDFDGDGWLDLYVTCFGPNRLYRNNGDGTFTEVAAKTGVADNRWSTGSAFADYDNDGDLDLFVANYIDFKLDDLPEFGKGALCQYRGLPVQCGPRGLRGAGDALFQNNGDGTFTDVSTEAGVADPNGYYGLGVVWSDFDEDGFVDLFVANDSRPNFLYKNNGNGTFTDIGFVSGTAVGEDGSEQGSMGIAVGDYDRDGRQDLFITNFSDEYNAFYRHEEAFLFADVSFFTRTPEASFPYVGWGTEFFDYDNDGWMDLIVVNGHVYPQVDRVHVGTSYAQPKLLYRNNRDRTFSEISAEAGPALAWKRVSRGLAVGDLDNDGDTDIVINDLDGPPMLLRNDGGNNGKWIRVRLENLGKNRFAIGARVKVTAGQLVQESEVRSGGSYLSQSDLRLHFGLDNRNLVDSIEVIWPDGGKTDVRKIEPNREIVIKRQ